jgi:hypothetical protein
MCRGLGYFERRLSFEARAVGKFTRDSDRLLGRSGQGAFPFCCKAGMIILHSTDII